MTIMKRADPEVDKREFSDKERKSDAKSGAAMPGGGYPIENKGDLSNAIRAIGRAKNPAATRRHIKNRAAALGASGMIPDTWKADLTERIAKQLAVDFNTSAPSIGNFLSECAAPDKLQKLLTASWEGWGNGVPPADSVASLFLKYVGDECPEAMDQIEASLDTSDQIQGFSKRVEALVEKAKDALGHGSDHRAQFSNDTDYQRWKVSAQTRALRNSGNPSLVKTKDDEKAESRGKTHTTVPIQRGLPGDLYIPTASKRAKLLRKQLDMLKARKKSKLRPAPGGTEGAFGGLMG